MFKYLKLTLILSTVSFAQQIRVDFEEYEPKSTLVVPTHELKKAKFPFIDIHNHQNDLGKDPEKFKKMVENMDALNMGTMVNLSGRGFGNDTTRANAALISQIKAANTDHPGRLVVFTNINFAGLSEPDFGTKAAKILENDVLKHGAMGLKIFKSLGFNVKDAGGKVVAVDDPRLDPIWAKAGELKVPVLIHTADPASFWDPLDRFNERWLELKLHAGRKRDTAKGDFSWQELIAQQHNVFRKHPKTTFINAHMGWYPNNLQHLDSMMVAFPNMYVEIGAVIAELGRQPRAANAFFTKWQDRVLFGKDSWVPEEYSTYFRTLETTDEYFPYHKKYHAFWRMYGMGLSDDVLKKLYFKNALRILPKLDQGQYKKYF